MLKILNEDFSPAQSLGDFENSCGDAGGLAMFLGRVRREDGVELLELQSYKGVTEAGILQKITEAKTRFKLLKVQVIHRIGKMSPGQPIVLVLCAAKHRRNAFLACDYLMDYLKTEAIFWKRQTDTNGQKWIEPRRQDYQDNERWK